MQRKIQEAVRWLQISSAILLILAAAGCGKPEQEKLPEIRNVLLISLDTTRADHLGCYGYPQPTTPHIDAVAAEGIVFDHAITPAVVTLPSHASMLTGTLPPYHGIHDNGAAQLDPGAVTLAEILGEEKKMFCGAIVSAFVLDSQFGLDQGFDTYDDQFDENLESIGIAERRGDEVNRHAMAWLDQHGDKPFFLLLHYYDPHAAYIPPEPFASAWHDNPYAGEIAYTDHCVGQVLDSLRARGLYESTLIVITADHGEMRGEHGEDTHGYFVYQGAVKVPLVVKLPGRTTHRRVGGVAGLADIVPTVCGLLGAETPPPVGGADLTPLLLNEEATLEDRIVYSESMYPTKYGAAGLLAVQNRKWKYIQTTRPELYNLVDDPDELRDLAGKQVAQAELMKAELETLLTAPRRAVAAADSSIDDRTRSALQSLGYVGGTVTADFTFDQSKDDPKDLLAFHHSHGRVDQLIFGKHYAEARTLGESLVTERPEFPDGWINLARISVELEDDEQAEASLEKVIELQPDHAAAHFNLARLFRDQDRLTKASEHARIALEIRPDYPEAHDVLGTVLALSGKPAEALDHLRAAVRGVPDSASTLNNLAGVYTMQGRSGQAIDAYREALVADPSHLGSLGNLAALLGSTGDEAGALACYRRIIAAEPDSVLGLNGVAWVLATSADEEVRDAGEAMNLAERAAKLTRRGGPGVLDTLAAAYAAAGRFEEAVTTAEEALRLLGDKPSDTTREIAERLSSYRNGKAYRQLLNPRKSDSLPQPESKGLESAPTERSPTKPRRAKSWRSGESHRSHNGRRCGDGAFLSGGAALGFGHFASHSAMSACAI